MRTLHLLSEKRTDLNTTPGVCEIALRDSDTGNTCYLSCLHDDEPHFYRTDKSIYDLLTKNRDDLGSDENDYLSSHALGGIEAADALDPLDPERDAMAYLLSVLELKCGQPAIGKPIEQSGFMYDRKWNLIRRWDIEEEKAVKIWNERLDRNKKQGRVPKDTDYFIESITNGTVCDMYDDWEAHITTKAGEDTYISAQQVEEYLTYYETPFQTADSDLEEVEGTMDDYCIGDIETLIEERPRDQRSKLLRALTYLMTNDDDAYGRAIEGRYVQDIIIPKGWKGEDYEDDF